MVTVWIAIWVLTVAAAILWIAFGHHVLESDPSKSMKGGPPAPSDRHIEESILWKEYRVLSEETAKDRTALIELQDRMNRMDKEVVYLGNAQGGIRQRLDRVERDQSNLALTVETLREGIERGRSCDAELERRINCIRYDLAQVTTSLADEIIARGKKVK